MLRFHSFTPMPPLLRLLFDFQLIFAAITPPLADAAAIIFMLTLIFMMLRYYAAIAAFTAAAEFSFRHIFAIAADFDAIFSPRHYAAAALPFIRDAGDTLLPLSPCRVSPAAIFDIRDAAMLFSPLPFSPCRLMRHYAFVTPRAAASPFRRFSDAIFTPPRFFFFIFHATLAASPRFRRHASHYAGFSLSLMI